MTDGSACDVARARIEAAARAAAATITDRPDTHEE